MNDPQLFWNEKYAECENLYGLEANKYIAQQSNLFSEHSKVLSLGEGEGRNALFLSLEGHEVTAIDISDVALQQARKLLESYGFSLHTLHRNLKEWEGDAESFDGVVISYCHLHKSDMPSIFSKAIKSLKPQGILIAEFFSLDQLELSSGGPKHPEFLYTSDELKEMLPTQDIEILELGEHTIELDEGTGHHGIAKVIRVTLKKR